MLLFSVVCKMNGEVMSIHSNVWPQKLLLQMLSIKFNIGSPHCVMITPAVHETQIKLSHTSQRLLIIKLDISDISSHTT
jgi:hypothetical protein